MVGNEDDLTCGIVDSPVALPLRVFGIAEEERGGDVQFILDSTSPFKSWQRQQNKNHLSSKSDAKTSPSNPTLKGADTVGWLRNWTLNILK